MTATDAVKSAAPVAAWVASLFNVAAQTAPLWPSNVPIQSPVSPCRSIGLPSTSKSGHNHQSDPELANCIYMQYL